MILTVSFLGEQDPFPVVVKYKLTEPLASSAAVGEYVILDNVVLLGLKIPVPPDQIPPLEPVTVPFNVARGFCEQSVLSAPAFAEIATENAVTVTDL